MKRTACTLAVLGLAMSGSVMAAGGHSRHDARHDGKAARSVASRQHDSRPSARWSGDARYRLHDDLRSPRHQGWRDARGREWHQQRDWYERYRADRWRHDSGRWYARQRFSIGLYVLPRGYTTRHWQRGQWLPSGHYSTRSWQLGDYWRFGLYDPPFAAHWVRVGNDALLVDRRSGEILEVVYQLFW